MLNLCFSKETIQPHACLLTILCYAQMMFQTYTIYLPTLKEIFRKMARLLFVTQEEMTQLSKAPKTKTINIP